LEVKVRDYFDRLIYATAIHYNATLLTEDEKLLNLYKGAYRPKRIIKWRGY